MIPFYLQYYEHPAPPKWDRCWGIAQDPQGHLWFGFNYLIRFDGTSFHRYDEEEGFSRDGTSYLVETDPTGKVWLGRFEKSK